MFGVRGAGGTVPEGYPGAPLMTVLARALVDRGHEVTAISTDFNAREADAPGFETLQFDGLKGYFCPQRARAFRPARGRLGRAVDLFAFERAGLVRAILHAAPDIVHAHWTYEFAWAAQDSRFPTLVTAHDSPWKVVRFMPDAYRLSRYMMARRVLRRSRFITAVSPDLKRDLAAYTDASVAVIANPISDELLACSGCDASCATSGTLMMVLNGWTSLKNASRALEGFALARRSRPRLRLVCFGAGYEKGGAANQWASRRGLAEGVDFRGSVPHEAVLDQARRSVALLHPSRWEACCMAIAEAMSQGLPVIAGRHTDGVPWQLDEGRAGVLVDVEDIEDIARGIGVLADDTSRWRAVSEASRRRARAMFAVDNVVDAYLNQYDTVLGSHRSGDVAMASGSQVISNART
jgi:glycosyltransferase involved in cell wall biosynthesis